MVARKYIVISAREARDLPAELQAALAQVVQAISDARAIKVPPKPAPHYWTLNMADKYALGAAEGYIEAVFRDEANNHQQGVKDAVSVAQAAREYAILRATGEKLPG